MRRVPQTDESAVSSQPLPFPLAGIRVLDLSRVVAGPFIGRIFADLGAEVVKVDGPEPDTSMYFGVVRDGYSGLYLQMNAGKRRIKVDLSLNGGQELLRRLAQEADVLIENFRPGVLRRLDLDWETLSAVNPRLVMVSITGFGQDGVDSNRRAYAPVIHGESGFLARQASFDGHPPKDSAMALADTVTGLHGAIAVLAALRLRDQTAAGQHVDLSMLEAMVATDDYAHYALDEAEVVRDARGIILQSDQACVIVAAERKVIWHQLCGTYKLRDPARPDSDLETKVSARWSVILDWARGFETSDALGAALDKAGLAWGRVRQPDAVPDVGLLRIRGAFQSVESRSGPRVVVRMPYHFSAARSEVRAGVADLAVDGPLVVEEWLNCDTEVVAEWIDQGALLL